MVRRLPDFIQVGEQNGKPFYFIENETTTGRTSPTKWNLDPRLPGLLRLAQGCGRYARRAARLEERDRLGEALEVFQREPEAVRAAMAPLATKVGNARAAGSLLVAPGLGLVTSPAVGRVTAPPHYVLRPVACGRSAILGSARNSSGSVFGLARSAVATAS